MVHQAQKCLAGGLLCRTEKGHELLEVTVPCRFKPGYCRIKPSYSRVRIFSIAVASGKRWLELQVSAQYATVLDTHHHTACTHAALYLLALVR